MRGKKQIIKLIENAVCDNDIIIALEESLKQYYSEYPDRNKFLEIKKMWWEKNTFIEFSICSALWKEIWISGKDYIFYENAVEFIKEKYPIIYSLVQYYLK